MFKTGSHTVSDEQLAALLQSTGVTLSKKESHSFSRTAFFLTHVVLVIFLVHLVIRIIG